MEVNVSWYQVKDIERGEEVLRRSARASRRLSRWKAGASSATPTARLDRIESNARRRRRTGRDRRAASR